MRRGVKMAHHAPTLPPHIAWRSSAAVGIRLAHGLGRPLGPAPDRQILDCATPGGARALIARMYRVQLRRQGRRRISRHGRSRPSDDAPVRDQLRRGAFSSIARGNGRGLNDRPSSMAQSGSDDGRVLTLDYEAASAARRRPSTGRGRGRGSDWAGRSTKRGSRPITFRQALNRAKAGNGFSTSNRAVDRGCAALLLPT